MKLRISPALVVSLVALFFALGGTAVAVTARAVPQARCAQGAVRGIVEVTGQPNKGVANVPDHYTSDKSYLGRVFNCGGGAVQVRRLTTGMYDVRFAGNPASSAVASGMGNDAPAAAIQRMPDGSFHLSLGTKDTLEDVPFTVVLL